MPFQGGVLCGHVRSVQIGLSDDNDGEKDENKIKCEVFGPHTMLVVQAIGLRWRCHAQNMLSFLQRHHVVDVDRLLIKADWIRRTAHL